MIHAPANKGKPVVKKYGVNERQDNSVVHTGRPIFKERKNHNRNRILKEMVTH